MLLVVTHERCLEHSSGRGHPERPERLRVVLDALRGDPALAEQLDWAIATPAPDADIERVHHRAVTDLLSELDSLGGGVIDGDTATNEHSFAAAQLASGAGLLAVERLRAGGHVAALCAVRPPGHHATPRRSMGFCLYNNIAITAAALAAQGERVAIVDFDVHHGNGTQDAFYDSPDVLFVSLHQHPWYPGSGTADQLGSGAGEGYTVNVPFPAGTTGGAYRRAFALLADRITAFAPTWLLVSAGFDGHRLDPLAELGLSAGDYADMVRVLRSLVAPGRLVAFLEGGYHLDALRTSVCAVAGELLGTGAAAEAPTADCEPPVLEALARNLARFR